ncbi:MAG TPA: DNA/RNA nuclease SfsA [Candidatus Flavonifractor merdigallinarum]|uniref:Sugar fermentation stimulation protein homolog n=1 Tax=Candidatus Flavonifractor merdigallinarum TaxID=2838589 RepID=A0A9D2BYL2_9FIRM|nr:DNA/RNA nuclease SfsA [Candidatus Flavonifractor merdigallinarum]
MQYQQVEAGRFLARPNRFIAQVEVNGQVETVHVKNTGRCRELLVPGATVYLERSNNPKRKTQYDLIVVEKGSLLINMDAQAPNRLFAEWAQVGHFCPNLTTLRPETTWGTSRFDFYWEDSDGKRGFVEVKGVTLEEEGLALFPDAPTERGVKHLRELAQCRAAGYEAAVCFVVQMAGRKGFSPNERTHPAFGAALRAAQKAGVEILVKGCTVERDSIAITETVPLCL